MELDEEIKHLFSGPLGLNFDHFLLLVYVQCEQILKWNTPKFTKFFYAHPSHSSILLHSGNVCLISLINNTGNMLCSRKQPSNKRIPTSRRFFTLPQVEFSSVQRLYERKLSSAPPLIDTVINTERLIALI